ncbi:uncharacterized protein [Hyperolius riggenbachi]|uniref:uncharacterized protein isoform X2 n=1 Tax=Hyperolius riggenbachi TaxID=752182 RepID=UPI0035A344DA
MMENHPLLTSLDEPSNSSPPKRLKSSAYVGDPVQEDQKISQDYQDEKLVTKAEVKQESEETDVKHEEPSKEIPPEITDSRETRRSRRLMQFEEEEKRLIRIKEEETPMEITTDSGGIRGNRRIRRDFRAEEEEDYVRVKVEEIHPQMITRETHPPSQTTRARIRARRFSEPENIVLIENLLPHFDRLFGRLSSQTDSTTKSRIWKSIANAVTALGGARRDVQHCKKRYQDIKGNIRKKIAAHQAAVLSAGDSARSKVPLFLLESEELLRPYLANNTSRGYPVLYDAQHASTSVVDTDFESDGPTKGESRSHSIQNEASQEHMEEEEDLDQSQVEFNEFTYGLEPETSEQEGPEDRSESSPHETSSAQPDVSEKSSVDHISRSHTVQHGRQMPPKAKKESIRELNVRHLNRFTRLQTLHRKMLSRQMTQLHEDVSYLVNATEEQNDHLSGITNFMERIAVALETRNDLEDKRQASLEQINDQVKEKLWRHSVAEKIVKSRSKNHN